jgi:predicted nucleic acid-binding protein
MLVVSDATPINVLVRIGRINILPILVGQVVIPTAVGEELSHPNTPAVVRDFLNNKPSWLEIRTPANPEDPLLPRHRGEREAIKLALELHADLLLMDELRPRTIATRLGIRVIGTIGLLEEAADRGLIDDLRAVHELIRQSGFHASDNILNASLKQHLSRRKE